MAESPGTPEHYAPPSEAVPTPPPPPMIGDAAQAWTLEQDQGGAPGHAAQYTPPASHGAPTAAHTAPAAGRSTFAAPPAVPRTPQGLAIAAVVLGVIAFITGWIPVWGVVVGLVAVILGSVALAKRQSKAMAITGLVTGGLGAALSVLVLVIVIVGANRVSDYADDAFDDPDYDDSYDYGYGNGTTTLGPEAQDGSLVVADQGFGATSYDDTEVWWVVILDNPSPYPYPAADITVNALDSSGRVVDSSWEFLSLPRGKTALTGVFFELDGARVASLEVVGPGPDQLGSEPASGELTTSALTAASDEWSTTVSGTVTSSFSEDLYGGSGVIVATDAAGEIIGAASTFTEALSSGQSVQFDAYFYDLMPTDATFEAFWTAY